MKFLIRLLFCLSIISLFSCSNDELDGTPSNLPSNVKSYKLYSFELFKESGRISLEEDTDGIVRFRVNLDQPVATTSAVNIYEGSFNGVNRIMITLNPIQAGETESITVVTQTDNGTRVSYEDLLNIDGHLKILNNLNNNHFDINTFTDLGVNAFAQGDEKMYPLYNNEEVIGVMGMLPREFEGKPMLIGVHLLEADDAYDYLPAIYEGTKATGNFENKLVDLAPILKFASKSSYTNCYDYLTTEAIVNGFGAVLLKKRDVIGKGDVGGNELTGGYNNYKFENVKDLDITGDVTLEERLNGKTLASYNLSSASTTPQSYAVNLNSNNYIQQDSIIVNLGIMPEESSETQYADIRTSKSGRELSYTELIENDYHIRINESTDPTYNGPNYFANADIGTAANSGLVSVTVLEKNEEENFNIFVKVDLFERVNGHTKALIKLTEHFDQDYELYLYEGEDFLDSSAEKVIDFNTLDAANEVDGYARDIQKDVNGLPITYEQIMSTSKHYRLIRKSDNKLVAFAIMQRK
ncbi:hypothetical protein [Flammeovirga kamogawensis]|uniref:DUF4270 domain-containing protein n=1 Tax=Flammeovirga kamogawensis TaxID=373891 RepID=A0ABX8GUM1_9BACT|nr:hypothetical protein [Flammeovirga kamogawensis]MBB6459634.1 hypothetical protein [Flammeovirga kamogawensis]QWG07303.1 hypothetical protein KM029_18665 [Flammeovirga kamogawensis]TRX69120.1 hypothetical protein EO216_13665 [Flammeovirga kamogawensis]